MQIHLIVDGYNLLHAAGLARASYGPGDLERARNRLLHRIRRGLSQTQRTRTTIVFDGREASSFQTRDLQFHGMRVTFSPPGLEADDTIEDLIASHSAPKQVIVVSSDHRLHKAARARKATAIDSDAFLDQLDQQTLPTDQTRTSPQTEVPEKPESVVDIEDWTQEFGNINVQEIAQSIQPPAKEAHSNLDRSVPDPIDATHTELQTPSAKQQTDDNDAVGDVSLHDVEFWESRIAELDNEDA